MSFADIFPNWQKVLRNALCVGAIVFASSGIAKYPPSLETLYTAIVGAVFAGIIEFVNAYYKKPNTSINEKAAVTFFF